MAYIIDNLRLRELVAIVQANKPFYDEFIVSLKQLGYPSVQAFVCDDKDTRALSAIVKLLSRTGGSELYDGGFRPYEPRTANWYFIAWLFRDAPVQRLGPMVAEQPGPNMILRRAYLLNEVRKAVVILFPNSASWEWAAVSEVMLARLEGSRRALKGTLFEAAVRRVIQGVLTENGLVQLKVGDREIRLHDETYDVQITGSKGMILIPVKSRETMGGGHALLFTRDIHKSISVAVDNGYRCLPIVIAESWGGDLETLATKDFIYIQTNPNQLATLEPQLQVALQKFIPLFQEMV